RAHVGQCCTHLLGGYERRLLGVGHFQVVQAGRAVHAERARIAQGTAHTLLLDRLAPGAYTLRATTPQARTEQRFVIH
ncbi:MAG TPA: hypothetical protein PLH93_13110, partial [Flavobacteriales bacterium]|nr:hypothetical protein [Flavobacteriales bacterium]